VHNLTETRLALRTVGELALNQTLGIVWYLDDAVRDIHLAAQRRKPDDKLKKRTSKHQVNWVGQQWVIEKGRTPASLNLDRACHVVKQPA
jgi:hypothetical protein